MTAYLLPTKEIERSINLCCRLWIATQESWHVYQSYETCVEPKRFALQTCSFTTMLSFCSKALILFPVIAIVFIKTAAIPYHGSQKFLGHNYWTSRYPSLGYTDWYGFWNDYYSGRRQYKRPSSETSGQACTGCQCDTSKLELKCSGNPGIL